MSNLAIVTIRLYQTTFGGKHGFLSLLFGGGCKHSPTCSEYTIREIRGGGFIRGFYRGTRRILSCY